MIRTFLELEDQIDRIDLYATVSLVQLRKFDPNKNGPERLNGLDIS
jgi:hypothetical protein